jgi:hypothetical protein
MVLDFQPPLKQHSQQISHQAVIPLLDVQWLVSRVIRSTLATFCIVQPGVMPATAEPTLAGFSIFARPRLSCYNAHSLIMQAVTPFFWWEAICGCFGSGVYEWHALKLILGVTLTSWSWAATTSSTSTSLYSYVIYLAYAFIPMFLSVQFYIQHHKPVGGANYYFYLGVQLWHSPESLLVPSL